MPDTLRKPEEATRRAARTTPTVVSPPLRHHTAPTWDWIAPRDHEATGLFDLTARYTVLLALLEATGPFSVLPRLRSSQDVDTHAPRAGDPYAISSHDSAQRTLVEYLRQTETAYSPSLNEALHELEQVDDEARNDGSPVPSSLAHGNARTLIEQMYRICRLRYAVYPLYKGEIVIEAMSENQDSVLVVCRSEGDIGCFVNMDDQSRQERYHDISGLPNGFLREALHELTHRSRRTA